MKVSKYNADILVVDDTRDNLRMLSQLLIEHGYYVRPVPDGKKAISAIHDQLPDLVLLDIMMPGMNGYEVCQYLQADELTRNIPIIFISALNETFDKVKAFSIGGRDYISKPFQAEEVLARVKTHLTLHYIQESLEAEIVDRKRIEEALRQYNQDLAVLNRMGQVLQTCTTEQDTYTVVTDSCTQLFPGSSGHLIMLSDDGVRSETVAYWGNPSVSQKFHMVDLDSVFLNEGHAVEHPSVGRIFSRIGYSRQERQVYVPVSSSEKLLAVLIFSFAPEESGGSEDNWQYDVESRQMLITEIAGHYALALVNLRLREMLRAEAIHDPLTGLYNRRHMEAALEREVFRADRHQSSVGIIMSDIDHFKAFNDNYGHEAGDAVLKEIASLLKCSYRGEDIACRYGGEEFLLILPDTTLQDASKRAWQLLKHCIRQKKTDGIKLQWRKDDYEMIYDIKMP
ncbi:MAG: diguanylate cyclase [Desulfobacteraceae bacterium]|nr:diguanylate cyclase [Desulfobacteraceae bacterium]